MSTNSECSRPLWSWEEDKAFENAVAINSGNINPWEKIVEAVPGRTVEEIKDHFRDLCADVEDIHSGLVPLPQYAELPKTSSKRASGAPRGRKRKNESGKESSQSSQTEGSSRLYGRKKGVPWSQEEHRLFLQGLENFGRGDWRSISRHCVLSRTSTQVASHAQKYFKRLDEVNKQLGEVNMVKKRSSIHDMPLDDGKLVTQQLLLKGLEGVTQSVLSIGNFPTLDSSAHVGSDKHSINHNVGVNTSNYLPFENAHGKSSMFEIPGSGFHSYPSTGQSNISTHQRPRTEQTIGARSAGLISDPIATRQVIFTPQGPSPQQTIRSAHAGVIVDQMANQHGISTFLRPRSDQNASQQVIFIPQGPSPQQRIGPADTGFISDQMANHHGLPTFQGPRSDQNIRVPQVNGLQSMPILPGKGHEQTLHNLMVTSQDNMLAPKCQTSNQTVKRSLKGYTFNFGESASSSNSGFCSNAHPTGSHSLLPSVASTVAESDGFGSLMPMMYDSGAPRYGSFSPAPFDLAELEFPFPYSDQS